MTTELMSFAEAAAAAVAESEQASTDETDTSLPEVHVEAPEADGQVDEKQEEQADSQVDAEAEAEGGEVEEQEESLFSDLETGADEEPAGIPDETEFELSGAEGPVTLAELKDGYLRQADYTRKTQDVAETKKANEKELEFVAALRANPDAVIRQMAVQAGLIDEGTQPSRPVDWSPLTSVEEMNVELEKLVNARLEDHPDVIAARRQAAVATIASEFDRIGADAGVTISDKDREVVLKEARRRGVSDLELVFANLMTQREKAAANKQSLKDAAPSRPTGTPSTEARTAPAGSFKEAAEMALLELGLDE